MGDIAVRLYNQNDLKFLVDMMMEAWKYYLQETNRERMSQLLKDQLDNPGEKIWVAFEGDIPVGTAEVSIVESYRYDGEEARLELLYIKDTASNYYDVHSAIMNQIFTLLRDEGIDFLRVDTTLENADIMFV